MIGESPQAAADRPSAPRRVQACLACRRRSMLLAALAGHIEHHRSDRHRLTAILALDDHELSRAVGAGASQASVAREVQARLAAGGDAVALCRHDPLYPPLLAELADAPAVLHIGGEPQRVSALLGAPAVAIVGARVPSEYGREVARGLAAALAVSGVCVVSGMAMGIDSAAHLGALEVGGATLAVLAGGADVAYPAVARGLHRRLIAQAGVVAELPSGIRPRRWCFVARNRIIAALAGVTVVVEARERSGALITAGYAADLGRDVAAIPGPVTSAHSAGTNGLIRDGAHLVRDAQDVLDLLFGVGARRAPVSAPDLEPRLARLLDRVRAGHDTPGALVASGVDLDEALLGLTELELGGSVRRSLAGHYLPVLR